MTIKPGVRNNLKNPRVFVPERSEESLDGEYVRAGGPGVYRHGGPLFALAAVLWGVVGMLVGVIIAAQLTWPALNLGIPG
jgi:hypothetical protein